MLQFIEEFLEVQAGVLTRRARGVLEAFVSIAPPGETPTVSDDELLLQIGRKEGRPLSRTGLRLRLKETGRALAQATAPFYLESCQGKTAAKLTDEAKQIGSIAAKLARHSQQKTLCSTTVSVQPMATPEFPELHVMFSYAWFNKLEPIRHRIQDELYTRLRNTLANPPEEYKYLPIINLWRDEHEIVRSKPADPQIDSICHKAFLGLILLSSKYHNSDNCMYEASFFINSDGQNQPGKACLIIPVDVITTDVPDIFYKHTRIWLDHKGKTLLDFWRKNRQEKNKYIDSLARHIWLEAKSYLTSRPEPLDVPRADEDPARRREENVQNFAQGRRYEFLREGIVSPLGHRGQLSREMAGTVPMVPVKIVPHLVEWAVGIGGPRLVALLGDFGMGKTVTCQLLTMELLERFKKNADTPLPVYLDLRDIEEAAQGGSVSLETLISDMLRGGSGDAVTSPTEVIRYVRERGALVIFDGLDEVTNKLSDAQAQKLYRQLLSIVPAEIWQADAQARRWVSREGDAQTERGPRILLSCRTHFFRDVATQRAFLTSQDRNYLTADDDVRAYFLCPFSSEQIREYLELTLPSSEADQVFELIKRTYNLEELARRPILLSFIRQTLSRLEKIKDEGRKINLCRLYDIFVEQTLMRDTPKHLLPPQEKIELLTELALTLHRQGRNEISNSKLDEWFDDVAQERPRLRRALRGAEGLRMSELFVQDLRNASLLVRPGETAFHFAHTSLQEFFLASAIHKAVAEKRSSCLEVPPPSPETIRFIRSRHEIAEPEVRAAFEEGVCTLMTSSMPAKVRHLGFEIWLEFGGNLPRPPVIDLSGLNLSQRVFRRGDFHELDLSHSRWQGTTLRQTEFDHVDLRDADFTGAAAPMSRWINCLASGAIWADADLTASLWRRCGLDAGAFKGSLMADAETFDCRIGAEPWTLAQVSRATGWRALPQWHGGWINAVAAGRLGERDVIVSGGSDGTVRVADVTSGRSLAVFEGHEGWVTSVACGRIDGRDIVVSGCVDATVRVTDMLSGGFKILYHDAPVRCAVLGRCAGADVVLSGCADGAVKITHMRSGQEHLLKRLDGGVHSLVLGHMESEDVVIVGRERGVEILNAETGKTIHALIGAGRWIVAFSQIGERYIVASANIDGTVRITDACNNDSIAPVYDGRVGPINSIVLTKFKGRNTIVAGGVDRRIRLLDVFSGESLAVVDGHTDGIRSIAIAQIGEHDAVVSGGRDGTVRITSIATSENIAVFHGHRCRINSLVLGRTGSENTVVWGGIDRKVRIADTSSGKNVSTYPGGDAPLNAVALGRIGKRSAVASGGSDGRIIVTDAFTKERLQIIQAHSAQVRAIALGRIGKRDVLVSGGADGFVCATDAASWAERDVLWKSGGAILSVAAGRLGGRDVAVSGGVDGGICVVDLSDGKVLAQRVVHVPLNWVNSVALGQAGGRDILISGGDDGTIRIADNAELKQICRIDAHNGWVTSVALGRAGGRDVAVSCGFGVVKFWDPVTRDCLCSLHHHLGWLRAVALGTREGGIEILATAGSDGSVRIADLAGVLKTGEPYFPPRQLVLGPAQDTYLELVSDGSDGYRLTRSSANAWRYFRAFGRDKDGNTISASLDTMSCNDG